MKRTEQTHGLFVNIDGTWRFEGFATSQTDIAKFEANVAGDVALTKNEVMKTYGCFVTELPKLYNKLNIEQCEPGKKYRIKYFPSGFALPRWAVMVFLGMPDDKSSLWDASPIAGTQSIRCQWLSQITEVDSSEPVYVNRTWDKPDGPPDAWTETGRG